MALSDDFLADLDGELSDFGQTLTLRRSGLSDLETNGFVRQFKPTELVQGVWLQQGDSMVVLSADGIGWPTSRLPRKGDKILLANVTVPRNIESVEPVYVDSTLIRINLVIRGT